MVKNPYKMLLFTITKFTLRGTLFLPPREEAWFRPVWEEGRCGGIVGGTCRVAHRFHWELGRQQVNIYELSPAEDFLSPISRCWIYLHIFFLGYLFQDNTWIHQLRIYANPTRESTTFVKLKRRNVSFLCETNISDSSNRHRTR